MKNNLDGAQLDNLSFGVVEIPPTMIVAAMTRLNISSNQTTFIVFNVHSLPLF